MGLASTNVELRHI